MSDDLLLPASLRLAWWGTAWLRGTVVTDLLIDEILGEQAVHQVREDDVVHPLAIGLGRLRALGATAFGAAFPAEGEPVGLGGPAAFNAAALEAGEAVVVVGLEVGLVPEVVGGATTWVHHPARRRPLADVGEADRDLRRLMTTTADRLADLDVARWRPEAADLLIDLRRRRALTAPPGVPARCADLAGRALDALEVCEVALVDDGGAVSVAEATARTEALRPLARAARVALVAAGSPEVWPPD